MSLLDLLDKYRVQYTQTGHHARSGWLQIQECPECDSQNYHLGIKLDGTRASCYRCGGKNVGKLLATLTKAPWLEIRAVCQAGIYVPRDDVTTHDGTYTPPTDLRPLSAATKHKKYLSNRHLDPEYCEKVWGCMATGPWSDHPFRVFIPLTVRKKPVAWTARAIANQEPRYITSSEAESSCSPKRLLMGADRARGRAIIVEGPTDLMRLGVGAVAVCGMAVTSAQVALMLDFNERYICFDNSPEAQKRAEALASELSVFPGNTSVLVIDADDPGSMSDGERELVRKTIFGKVAEWE